MKNNPAMKDLIFLLTALCTALISGLFYAYSCSVNIGLGQLRDNEYLRAMQAINSAIQNPLFFLSFMGTLILLSLNAWIDYQGKLTPGFILMLAAAIIYLVGVFGVTIFGNVPLNDSLATFDIGHATEAQLAAFRSQFEKPWLFYHNIRTVLSIVCLVLVLINCLYVRIPHRGM